MATKERRNPLQTASGGRTQGPEIPTYAQVRMALDELHGFDQAGLRQYQTAWKNRSVQVWNPFAAPGSLRVV